MILIQPSPTFVIAVAVALGRGFLCLLLKIHFFDYLGPFILTTTIRLETALPVRATFGGKRCPEALDAATGFQCSLVGNQRGASKFERDTGFLGQMWYSGIKRTVLIHLSSPSVHFL